MTEAFTVVSPLVLNTKLESAYATRFGSSGGSRLRRWSEQIASGEPKLIRFAQLAFLREKLPNDMRTKFCLARIGFGHDDVSILFSQEHKSRIKGAAVCGSVWTCPVCAERITAVRRKELKKLLAVTKYRVVMVTTTLEHHQGESLKPMVDALNHAHRRMKTGRPWKRLCEKWGILGDVWSLENTHGINGHHPHRHTIFILDPSKVNLPGKEAKRIYETEFQKDLYELYYKQLVKAGRDCDEEHGLVVSANRKEFGDYIAKWGVTEELTRSTHKLASNGGKSVWELLSMAVNGDAGAWSIFLEYARAFKGKKQLNWSNGLRELLGLGEEMTDEQAAKVEQEPEDKIIVAFTRLGWYFMLEKDLLGPTLKFCDQVQGDTGQVLEFLFRRGLRKFIFPV